MRYSLFDNEQEATDFAKDVQVVCTPNNVILSVFLQWNNKWVVSMPIEPPILKGEVVTADALYPPQSEEPI